MKCDKCGHNTDPCKTTTLGPSDAHVWVVWTCKYCGKDLQASFVDRRNLQHHIEHYGKEIPSVNRKFQMYDETNYLAVRHLATNQLKG